MAFKKYVGLVSIALVGGVIAVGCSSSDNNNNGGTDAGADSSKPKPDAAVEDSGGGDQDASTCTPSDVGATFSPKLHKPTLTPTACTPAQILSFRKCLGGTTAADCTGWGGTVSDANKACNLCLVTDPSLAKPTDTFGPVLSSKGFVQLNVAGCVQIRTNDVNGTGYGSKLQAADECYNEACSANCPVTDDASLAELNKCINAAAAGTCKTFTDTASAAEPDGGLDECFPTNDFLADYDRIAPIFCGGAGAADGGSDAKTD